MKTRLKIFLCIILLAAGIIGANWCLNGQLSADNGKKSKKNQVEKVLKDTVLVNPETEVFETGLPVIYIDTNGEFIQKEYKTKSKVAINNSEGELHSVTDEPEEAYYATVNYRGNSSFSRFEKKSYRIKFFKNDKYKRETEVKLCGMAENSEWVLNGPYLDMSLMRNKLSYDLGREIMNWAPNTHYCELFVNGEYQGLYLAIEPITNGEGRLNLSEYGLLAGNTAFIVKRDRVNTEKVEIATYGTTAGKTYNALAITYPAAENLTGDQEKWITDRVSAFEKALYSEDFDQTHEYTKYIDVDEFVDYYILNEFALNYDAGNLSTYAYADLNGKIAPVVWDFNNGYNNYQGRICRTDTFYIKDNSWFNRLVEDRYFVDLVVARYHELRESSLDEDHIMGMLDGYRAYLGDAIDRNFDVWGFSFHLNLLAGKDEEGNKRDIRSYDEAVSQLKGVISDRLAYMDGHIEDLYEEH